MKKSEIINELIKEVCDTLKVLPNLEEKIDLEKLFDKRIKKFKKMSLKK